MYRTRTKDDWIFFQKQVQDRFDQVFGKGRVNIGLHYHENDYADHSIDIGGVLEIGEVEYEVPTIRGKIYQKWWQLYGVTYDPGNYHQPPDCDVKELGEPKQLLDACIGEAINTYAEWWLGDYLDHLADEEACQAEEEYENGPHSWKSHRDTRAKNN